MRPFLFLSMLLFSCNSPIDIITSTPIDYAILELNESMSGQAVIFINGNNGILYKSPIEHSVYDTVIINYKSDKISTFSISINGNRKAIYCKFIGDIQLLIFQREITEL